MKATWSVPRVDREPENARIYVLWGDDLLLPSAQAETVREDPYLTIVPFPCDAWSAINNVFPPKERRLRQAQASEHVQFAFAIGRHRMEHGRH
eukprot:555339-Pyramimonas_sp.AAC.1